MWRNLKQMKAAKAVWLRRGPNLCGICSLIVTTTIDKQLQESHIGLDPKNLTWKKLCLFASNKKNSVDDHCKFIFNNI